MEPGLRLLQSKDSLHDCHLPAHRELLRDHFVDAAAGMERLAVGSLVREALLRERRGFLLPFTPGSHHGTHPGNRQDRTSRAGIKTRFEPGPEGRGTPRFLVVPTWIANANHFARSRRFTH
jgi:hypothetical protein